jgi:hypothetical protein
MGVLYNYMIYMINTIYEVKDQKLRIKHLRYALWANKKIKEFA